MQAAQKPLDIAVSRNWLKGAGDFEAIGGSAYLAEIMTAVPTAAYAVHYAEIVKEKAARRAIIEAGTELLRSAWDEQTEVPEIINQAEASLQGIRTGTFEEAGVNAQAAVLKFIDRVEAIQRRKQHLGLPTGFKTFDAVVGGLFPGEFCILAARPSVGKTALAAQIAGYNAARGRLVYFVSLEMDDVELVQRDILRVVQRQQSFHPHGHNYRRGGNEVDRGGQQVLAADHRD